MKCERRDLAIAKLAGGDLPEWRAARLQQHLDVCPRCIALYIELGKQCLDTHDAHLTPEVRGQGVLVDAVLSRTADKRPRIRTRAAIAALTAAILVGAVAWQLPRSTSEQTATVPVESVDSEAPITHRTIELARTQRSNVVIKLMTSNPDVVIYWLGESTGEL